MTAVPAIVSEEPFIRTGNKTIIRQQRGIVEDKIGAFNLCPRK